ncbi:MAG: carboxypeptidase-like regulatory domain-containing protein, partial [Bacteroidota bacterium]|nr:carboxypeptidase-like regulatory domain-containing protein [Bacteroidota bacterium]
MKKKLIGGISLDREKVRKIWMTMRLIVLLFFVSLLHVSASVYSQKTKLNIRVENATLQQVFKVLQEQSEFDFFYKNEQIPADARVSIETKNETIEVILNKVLTGTGLTYHVLDKDIVISTKGAAKSEMISQQQKSVSGKVTDSSGESLPGVSVVVKGTTTGTITDANGNYSLPNVPESATLQFSFVGMKGQEVIVAGKTSVNIKMEEDAIGIDEVIAVVYQTLKKSDLTGSISSVSADNIVQYPVSGPQVGLQGKTSGVTVIQNSGAPGAPVSVRIRGSNSIMGTNEPLYVVDGFALASTPNSINPSDIRSIEVLKDASSTAIYGSRGANGVILITTKSGKTGKTDIILDSYYAVQEVSETIDMMNAREFAEIANERAANDGGAPYFTQDQIKSFSEGTNWQKELFRTAPMHNHSLSFSGG